MSASLEEGVKNLICDQLAVEAENLAGKASGGLHLAFGEFEQEQPLDQHRIGGVEFERLPEIIGGEIIVAELAGRAADQIGAREGLALDGLGGARGSGDAHGQEHGDERQTQEINFHTTS